LFANLGAEVRDVDRPVAERAAELRVARPSLRTPDAIVLATADVHDVDLVLTTDRRWAGVLGGRRIELLQPAG
jgi:predicted nucleic acid-binding protein